MECNFFVFQINGSRPSVCWKKIYRKIDKLQNNSNGCQSEVDGSSTLRKPGSFMFGFSLKQVSKLIQVCNCSSNTTMCRAFIWNVVDSKLCFMMASAFNCAFD